LPIEPNTEPIPVDIRAPEISGAGAQHSRRDGRKCT
jgi:hypothetical protein